MITSGSVFVFDEDESGIKRWTDGFFWSPSRILGNFLLYRETDKRGAGHRGVRTDPPETVNEHSQYNVDGARLEGQSLSRPKGDSGSLGVDRQRERVLVGSLTNSYKFKADGLMKKVCSSLPSPSPFTFLTPLTRPSPSPSLASPSTSSPTTKSKMSSRAVFAPPPPCPSSHRSTSVQNISTRPIFATHPRSRLASMASPVTVAKQTTSIHPPQ